MPAGQGIEIDDLVDPEAAHSTMVKDVAQEVLRKLKAGQVTVGDDLDLLDADMLGDEKADDKGDGKSGSKGGSSGGLFGDFGLGSILQLAGNLAQAGVNVAQSEQTKSKSASDLSAAIAADAAASQAAAQAGYSLQHKLPRAAIDASASAQAAATQVRAGAGLPPEFVDKRLQAANTALAAARAKALANLKDDYALAVMNAWQATVNKIQNVQLTGGDKGGDGSDKGGGGGKSGGSAGKGQASGDSWWDQLLHWLHLK